MTTFFLINWYKWTSIPCFGWIANPLRHVPTRVGRKLCPWVMTFPKWLAATCKIILMYFPVNVMLIPLRKNTEKIIIRQCCSSVVYEHPSCWKVRTGLLHHSGTLFWCNQSVTHYCQLSLAVCKHCSNVLIPGSKVLFPVRLLCTTSSQAFFFFN